MGEQQRNTIIMVVLIGIIIVGWQFFFTPKQLAQQPQTQTQTQQPPTTTQPAPDKNTAPAAQPNAAAPAAKLNGTLPATLADALAEPRVKITTPSLSGSIALKGARVDNLQLLKYRETTDPNSPPITLLSPPVGSGKGAYFAESGWSTTDKSAPVPASDTVWTASAPELTPEKPVTLTWDNGAGLVFKRTYAVDADYMFTITDTVENHTDKAIDLSPYGNVAQWETPPLLNFSVLHEGPIGVLDGSLKDKGIYGVFLGVFGPNMYKGLKDDAAIGGCAPDSTCHGKKFETTGGWLGFTDKYFATLMVPDQAQKLSTRMFWNDALGFDHYQTDWIGPAQSAAPGGTAQETTHLFAGAKVLALLDGYSAQLKAPNMHLAIDFGLYRFLTLPLFKFLRFIHEQVPNFGLAILIFTVCVRGAFFPIANRSYKSMNKMKMLQPEIKKLQARYGDDRAKLNQEMMALYKREKANPVSGCLPLVIQIPVFFALYKVLLVTIEMRHAPFFGWIHDLSAQDPTTIFNLFGLIPWNTVIPGVIELPHIGLWPLAMGITMYLQQKLNPQPPDPIQAKMFMILPVVFTFMMAKFPAGLVIYWSCSNTLSIAQQWIIRRQMVKR